MARGRWLEAALYQTAPAFAPLLGAEAECENGCCEKLVFQ